MKPIQPLFLLLLVPFFSFSQIQGEDEVYLGGDRIEPQFNGGGIEQFGEFVNTHFNYSKVSKPGKMVAAFTIDTDGSVQKIKMIQMIDSESAIEMIRVLNECPKWKPASRGGKPISVEIKYPMVFRPKSKPEKKESKAGEVPVQSKVSEPIDNRTYKEDNIEVAPQFPGGRQEFLNYISTNFKLPEARNISGKVVVSFVVERRQHYRRENRQQSGTRRCRRGQTRIVGQSKMESGNAKRKNSSRHVHYPHQHCFKKINLK